MGVRDQIKLKYKLKNNKNPTSTKLEKKEFIFENNISKKVEDNDLELQKKFDENIIVKIIL